MEKTLLKTVMKWRPASPDRLVSSQNHSYRFRKHSCSWREDFSCVEKTVFKGVLVVLKSNSGSKQKKALHY